MSVIYNYDGSLNGFLTVIFDIYEKKRPPFDISSGEFVQTGFFSESEKIITDIEKSSRVERGITAKVGNDGFFRVIEAFCCGCEPLTRDMKIYKYLKLLFEKGGKVTEMYNIPEIADFNDLVLKTGKEAHLMKGFLRFKRLSCGILYAEYEPDNDITHFLTPYFAARNAENEFIIHDVGRGIFGLYNKKNWTIALSCEGFDAKFAEEEIAFQDLWQQYYNTVTISSRKSNKRRAQFMARRYWKYLTEFVDESI